MPILVRTDTCTTKDRNTSLLWCCQALALRYYCTKREIVCVRASVCPDMRSLKVALTPRLWLAFQSTEKPGGVWNSRAESAWITIANGLDVQLCGRARQP